MPFPSIADEPNEDKAVALSQKSAAEGFRELTSQLPHWFPAKLRDLLVSCLAFEPEKRLSADILVMRLGAMCGAGYASGSRGCD